MTGQKGADSKAWRLNSSFAASMRQAVRRRRRKQPFRFLAQLSEKYLRAYYNEGFFEFERNGEGFALQTFREWAGTRDLVLWDVGANEGGWAREAQRVFPEATIHSFEILPPIADAFAVQFGDNPRVHLHRIGLSEEAGEVDVTWNTKHHTTSAINYRASEEFGGKLETLTCDVSTIDAQVSAGMPAPDLLKIDTEGHDPAVLRGAKALLGGDDAPAMIQFEYGDTWLPARETLAQTQAMLEELGYQVGRIYPEHVAFKPYSFEDDHFRMGNMIAARDPDLIAALRGD